MFLTFVTHLPSGSPLFPSPPPRPPIGLHRLSPPFVTTVCHHRLSLTCNEVDRYTKFIFDRLNLDAQPARFRIGHDIVAFKPTRTTNNALTAVEVNYPSDAGLELYFHPLPGPLAKIYAVGFSLFDLLTSLLPDPITPCRLRKKLIDAENDFNRQFCPRVNTQLTCKKCDIKPIPTGTGIDAVILNHFLGHILPGLNPGGIGHGHGFGPGVGPGFGFNDVGGLGAGFGPFKGGLTSAKSTDANFAEG